MQTSTTKNDLETGANVLTLTKVAVFLHTISQAGWNRFSGVYMLSHSFSASEIGAVNSSSKVAKVLAQPLWGMLSDAADPRGVMVLSTILGTLSLDGIRRATVQRSISSVTWWRMFRSALTAASPAMDALVLRFVEGTSEGYGQQRLWGSVAWGLSAVSAGAFLDKFGETSIFVYTYSTSALLVGFLVFLGKVHKPHEKSKEQHKLEQTKNICSFFNGFRDLTKRHSWSVWIVLIHSTAYGLIMVLFDGILMLQLERDFKMSRSKQGLATFISILSTIPVYHYSQAIRKRLGHLGMIGSSILVAALRLCLIKYACSDAVAEVSKELWLLPLQILHGYHFAANWVACVEILDTSSARRLRSLKQFLLNMAYFTVGSGVGNIYWGVMYDQKGAQAAYSRGLWFCLIDALLLGSLRVCSKPSLQWKESGSDNGDTEMRV